LKIRICFVCLGNICRSPTAEGVMRGLVEEAGLAQRIEIDSAGTSSFHVGECSDSRSREAAAARGIRLDSRSRQFEADDFARFDYVLAMDVDNQRDLLALALDPAHRSRVTLLRGYAPGRDSDLDVPDPYYGGEHGFDRVLDICQASCRGLLEHILARHEFS
jgi:protein-tyrosine phosphatase